ncbi:MAG: hypothetical protein ACXVAY_04655 [Mucilaginibacter sp.]
MKNSTRLFLTTLAITTFFITNVKAQTSTSGKWRIDAGLEGGFTTGELRTISKNYDGGTLRLQYKLSENDALMLTGGYYYIATGTNSNTYTAFGPTIYVTPLVSLGIAPVKLGYKRFLIPEFYASAEAGVGFETQYANDKKLILSPGIGWQGDSFDIGLRYERFSGQSNNYGMIGLRVAYGFGF